MSHVENGIVETARVESAMKAVDRKDYCPFNSYMDSPQSIGNILYIAHPRVLYMYIAHPRIPVMYYI